MALGAQPIDVLKVPLKEGVSLALTVTALAATYFPARHASYIDPIQSFRYERALH
jgi:ABC-type lipoprotein release transport system permease subunit